MVKLTLAEAKQLPQGVPTIVVPYRDNSAQERASQLKKFVSHMARYHPSWPILIIEQSQDDRKFNRGALLNIGARIAYKLKHTYVIFHDVDLIPLAPLVPYYTAFPEKPIHIGSAWTTKWQGDSFMGGVMSMSISDIQKMNGFPNMFWGWGGEDDAMRNRLKKKNIQVFKLDTDKGFKELPHVDTRSNQEWKNMRKWEDIREDSGRHGFNDVQWTVIQDTDLAPNVKKITAELK
jgi:hypothetical protein